MWKNKPFPICEKIINIWLRFSDYFRVFLDIPGKLSSTMRWCFILFLPSPLLINSSGDLLCFDSSEIAFQASFVIKTALLCTNH